MMAKSMRSKREKRLRAIRRDLAKPLLEKKDATKLAVLEAALAAPKLPVKSTSPFDMDVVAPEAAASTSTQDELDTEMQEEDNSKTEKKPMGKRKKLKLKIAKKKSKGKGKFRRRHI